MNGTVVSVSVNSLVVNAGGIYYTVAMEYGALVTLNGITCFLADLLPGDAVNLTLTTDPTNQPAASVITATR